MPIYKQFLTPCLPRQHLPTPSATSADIIVILRNIIILLFAFTKSHMNKGNDTKQGTLLINPKESWDPNCFPHCLWGGIMQALEGGVCGPFPHRLSFIGNTCCYFNPRVHHRFLLRRCGWHTSLLSGTCPLPQKGVGALHSWSVDSHAVPVDSPLSCSRANRL